MPIEATVTLRNEDVAGIGRKRIRLLQAVAREGSISAGARAVGLTYKAAWDALDAMANLFGRPLLETHAGGKAGGGARLTPAGVQVIAAFDRLEGEIARVWRELEGKLDGSGISPRHLMSGFMMRTSARNALRGTIVAIRSDTLNSELTVEISGTARIFALVTNESVAGLGLCVGRDVILLIKASFVMIAVDPNPLLSARNSLPGVVQRCERSEVNAEVVVDIGEGRTLAATITAHSADALGLVPGKPVCAFFDPSHVIIAVD